MAIYFYIAYWEKKDWFKIKNKPIDFMLKTGCKFIQKKQEIVSSKNGHIYTHSLKETQSMDFEPKQLNNGHRFWTLSVIDEYSREVVGQLTSFSLTRHKSVDFLTQIGKQQDQIPMHILCDSGPECICKALFFG